MGALSVSLHAQNDADGAAGDAAAAEGVSTGEGGRPTDPSPSAERVNESAGSVESGSVESGSAESGSRGSTAAETEDEAQLTFADEPAGAGAEAPQSLGGFTTWDFVRMILVLAGVIGAIYGVFWLLKRGSRGKVQNSQLIRVLGSHGLPGNKGLHLVEIGNQVFLLGTGDETVRLIAEITDKESVDEVKLLASQQESNRPKSFGEALSGVFAGGGAGMNAVAAGKGLGGVNVTSGSEGNGESAGPLDFLHKQRERLKNLH